MKGGLFRLSHNPRPQLAAHYDAVIVGAGLVGCALASRLARAKARVLVLDPCANVGEGGASKSNSAIIHTGFDAEPASLEAALVTSASRRWPRLAATLKIPYSEVGALMIATSDADMSYLAKYQGLARQNGVDDVRMLSARETRDLAPHAYADSAVLASLLVPREAVVDPFATCVAFAESAVRAGAHFLMEARPERVSEGVCVRVSGALEFRAKTLVNCAGLGARGVADLYGGAPFEQNPRRGQFLVYANPSLLGQILLPIPSKLGKGVLVAPTVFGQLIAGPTAEDLPMESADEAGRTTREGLEFVRHRAQLMLPALRSMRPFGQWAGARANCAQGSYLLRYNDGLSGCVTVAGVRSTGLSSSFALADALAQGLAASCGLDLGAACEPERARDEYPSWFQRPVAGGAGLARGPAREAAPEPTLCFCEGTTRSDISKALGSCLRPNSTDAVKRYTRATMGKCQGFNCLVAVSQAIAQDLAVPLGQVTKTGAQGTEWFPGATSVLARSRPAPPFFSAFGPEQQQQLLDVVVVGAGPAGLGVAAGLHSLGVDKVLVLERRAHVGGVPARYSDDGPRTFFWGGRASPVAGAAVARMLASERAAELAVRECDVFALTRAAGAGGGPVLVHTRNLGTLRARCVVLATGAREATAAERGVVAGHRPAGVVFSNHLLELEGLDSAGAVFAGAGLVARGAAAGHSFGSRPARLALLPGDEHPLLGALWFGGGPPNWDVDRVQVWGPRGRVERLDVGAARGVEADMLILAGGLVGCDELAFAGPLGLRDPGVVLAGNAALASYPAWLCYLHGKLRVARKVKGILAAASDH